MNFLDKIRQSDNPTKLRYLILFSSLAGIVVFAIFAVSLRSTLEEINNPPEINQDQTSFIDNMRSAWSGIKERTKNTIDFFKEKFSETKDIAIDKTNN